MHASLLWASSCSCCCHLPFWPVHHQHLLCAMQINSNNKLINYNSNEPFSFHYFVFFFYKIAHTKKEQKEAVKDGKVVESHMEEVSYIWPLLSRPLSLRCWLHARYINYVYSAAACSWCFMQRYVMDPNQSRILHDWPLYISRPAATTWSTHVYVLRAFIIIIIITTTDIYLVS